MFRITIVELPEGSETEIKRLEQCIDAIDLQKIILAINAKPRKPRTPAKKEQAK